VHFDTPEQQLQADLVWAATSADMIEISGIAAASGLHSISCSPAASGLVSWLRNNDHSSKLQSLIQQRQPRRLGIYYEALWQTIFEHYPGFDLICQNLTITKNSRTLGEMDFIYYCQHRQQYVHLETAVKFYLGVPENDTVQATENTTTPWHQWIGPGCKDRLDIKLNRMLEKQTQLSTTTEGISALKQLDIIQPLREICLKGYFFYPLNRPFAAPQHSHQNHSRGHWLALKDMDLLGEKGEWLIMKKVQWLAPASLPKTAILHDLKSLKADIASRLSCNSFPIMIANLQLSNKGGNENYRESARYFITPDDWPTQL